MASDPPDYYGIECQPTDSDGAVLVPIPEVPSSVDWGKMFSHPSPGLIVFFVILGLSLLTAAGVWVYRNKNAIVRSSANAGSAATAAGTAAS